MDRRRFVASAASSAALGLAGALPTVPAVALEPVARRADIATSIDVSEHDGPVEVWVPVFEDAPPFQQASAPRWSTTGTAALVRDAVYGARMVRARWTGSGAKTLTIEQTVRTSDRGPVATTLSEAERRFWLRPMPSLPTDGIVREHAREIVGTRTDPAAKARALYDWIVDHTFRDPASRGCGVGDVGGLLRSGRLGGKCADLNSLMTALCRASGIPARDVYGIRFAPSNFDRTLGISASDISHAQHCRAEVWLDGTGWFPVDPADVRKVVLEDRVTVDSAAVAAERERLFGHWEMNWAAYNSATDIALPGATRSIGARFLMYPYGMTPDTDLDWLAPDRFRYRITARTPT